MTNADMVEAISAVDGSTATPLLKTSRVAISQIEAEAGTRVARWGNAEYSAVRYRSSYASGFRMIVTSLRLDAYFGGTSARHLSARSRGRKRKRMTPVLPSGKRDS